MENSFSITWTVEQAGQLGPYKDSVFRYTGETNLSQTQTMRFCKSLLRPGTTDPDNPFSPIITQWSFEEGEVNTFTYEVTEKYTG